MPRKLKETGRMLARSGTKEFSRYDDNSLSDSSHNNPAALAEPATLRNAPLKGIFYSFRQRIFYGN